MNTEHFQKSTAYLDGVLMTLKGDKVVIITFGTQQERFYVAEDGTVNRCGEQAPVPGSESDFERYRMAFLEALISGGSLILRQIGVARLPLPEALGGGTLPLDYLYGAEVGPKGIRPLRGATLKQVYGQGEEATEFRDFPAKEQVKVALARQIETVPQAVGA